MVSPENVHRETEQGIVMYSEIYMYIYIHTYTYICIQIFAYNNNEWEKRVWIFRKAGKNIWEDFKGGRKGEMT